MDIFKIIGIGFLTLIITIILKEYKKEYAIYAVLMGGALILLISMNTVDGIIQFIRNIYMDNNKYNDTVINLLMKITGIAILIEYAVSICKDLGESAIANKIDFGGKIIIISLSIPIISDTLNSITRLLP